MAKYETDGTDQRYWPAREPGDDPPPEHGDRRATDPRQLPGPHTPDHDLACETGASGHEEPEHLQQGHPPGTLYGCRRCEAGDCQHEPGDGDDWCVSDRHPPREAEGSEPRREMPASGIPGTGREQGYVARSPERDTDREAAS